MVYSVELGEDGLGNVTRIEKGLRSLPSRLEAKEKSLANLHQQVENLKAELQKPFAQEQEYLNKSARLDQLTIQLSLDNKSSAPATMEPEAFAEELFRLACEYSPKAMEDYSASMGSQISMTVDMLQNGDTGDMAALLQEIKEKGTAGQKEKAATLLDYLSEFTVPIQEEGLEL